MAGRGARNAHRIRPEFGRLNRIQVRAEDGHPIPLSILTPAEERGLRPFRGTIFVPPLLGGDPLQNFAFFAPLLDRGWHLASLGYRGHRRTPGFFDLKSARQDTLTAAEHLACRDGTGPLVALGACFAALPVLFTASRRPGLFQGLVFVNAVLSLRHICSPSEALSLCRRQGTVRHLLDLPGWAHALAVALFPGVDSSRAHFGTLAFARAKTLRCMVQYFLTGTVDGPLGFHGPSLCCYGRQDTLLRLDCPRGRARYERRFRDVLPRVRFFRHPACHWWRGQERTLVGTLAGFLDQISEANSKMVATR
ncbi:MAG: hypothetical protein EOM25_09740 [Deltaproteobacteria bacterium]|nr:hypothetical protein [Deltaproteobacteria bacterium]